MKQFKYIIFALLLVGGMLTTSCSKDFLDVDYTNGATSSSLKEVPSENIGSGSLLGIYNFMVSRLADAHDVFGYMSIMHAGDMTAGDIVQTPLHWFMYDYAMDNRAEAYRRTNTSWTFFYSIIDKANNIIEPLDESQEGAAPLLGQAYALRGMSYYYLIQLYQKGYTSKAVDNLPGVPIYVAPKEGENKIGRNTVKEVIDQAQSDLEKAVNLLEGYKRESKMYINANVANGLLARHYLLTQQYQKAYDAATKALEGQVITPVVPNDFATEAIDKTRYTSLEEADWMWGFPIDSETSTIYASFFSHISNLSGGYAGLGYASRAIDAALYSQISDTDARKTLFIPGGDSKYLNYKFGSDPNFLQDYMYMRSPEMVLIQAEALAHLGKNAEAASALKVLMKERDPEWNGTSVTVEDVHLQRRIELWGEGFSFFDMKRLGVGRVSEYKGSNHPISIQKSAGNVGPDDKRWFYQIPRQEMQENPELEGQQNP